jgi:uncharacterized protein YbjT (DUF2867 family)
MMTNDLYVVTGATGNIGRKIVEGLLAAKLKVRAIARNSDRLKALASKGAQIFPASLDDTGSITHAFTGAKAVFTMVPPNYETENFRGYQNQIANALAASITGAGVDFVVNLSSVGAHHADKLGPINGLHDLEQRFNKLNSNILHLRPTYFMENHLSAVQTIHKMNIYGSPVKPDLAFPMIATVDVAAEAVERLKKLDFKGKSVKELLGPRDYTMNEVTSVITQVLNKPDVKYVQFPYDDAEKAMVEMGFSANVASLFVQMTRGINEGIFKAEAGRSAKNTTPTKFEEFAKIFPSVPIETARPAKKKSAAKRR